MKLKISLLMIFYAPFFVFSQKLSDKFGYLNWSSSSYLENYGYRSSDGLLLFTELPDCPENNQWIKVFEDNFDGNNLDNKIWKKWNTCAYSHPVLWDSSLINVSDGLLHLYTVHDPHPQTPCMFRWDDPNTPNINEDSIKYVDYKFTAGAIESKFPFSHGLFEIRCKIPSCLGSFPAFWLYSGYNNEVNEIDIFEFWPDEDIPSLNFREVSFNIHKRMNRYWHPFFGYEKDFTRRDNDNLPQNAHYISDEYLSDTFHTFSCTWDPYTVQWYVDGVRKYTWFRLTDYMGYPIVRCSNIRKNVYYDAEDFYPNQPMHIIINNSVNPEGANETPFPSNFEIDWVRYYQKINTEKKFDNCVLKNDKDLISFISASEIVLGGDCEYIVENPPNWWNDGKYLYANALNTITLKPGFKVKPGGYFHGSIISIKKSAMTISADSAKVKINKKDSLQNIKHLYILSPNPTNGLLKLEFKDPSNLFDGIMITNSLYQVISSTTNRSDYFYYDMSGYTKGVYFLFIKYSGKIFVERVILQ